jgi:ribosomal protein S18 acetylase RimI-like enzyme
LALTIRKAELKDVEQMANVHVDSWRTTYKGIVSEEYLNTLKYENRERLWESALSQDIHYIWVAEVDGKVIGFVSGGKERTGKYGYDGELYAIYLLKEYQGNGIGYNLVKSFFNEMHEAGFSSVLLWVLADNPSVRFYESLNPEKVATEQIEIGGQYFEEIGYGWRSLLPLVNSEKSKKLS